MRNNVGLALQILLQSATAMLVALCKRTTTIAAAFSQDAAGIATTGQASDSLGRISCLRNAGFVSHETHS
jgi:hypothetical protein